MDRHLPMIGATVARATTPDFINPTAMVNGGIWSLLVAATAFLGLRLWCKIDRSHGLWYDDYILIAAWIVLSVDCIIISVEFGTGYVVKTWDDRMLILVSVSSVLTTIGQAWTKTAFAVTLLRPGITQGWQRWVLWFIIASLNIYVTITFTLQWTNYCGKDAEWWKIPHVCVAYKTIFRIKMGRNMYNIITDFVLALIPWVVTWNLRIKRCEKIGICVTMSLGVFVAIISAWRTAFMMSPGMNDYNAGYFKRQGISMIWYIGEVAGTIIVQTLPIIRHLFQNKSEQKSLVSVPLNEVSILSVTKSWSEGEHRSSGHGRKVSKSHPGWMDVENGLAGMDARSPKALSLHLRPRQNSWSTYSHPRLSLFTW